MGRNKLIHWTYNSQRPKRDYIDPRLPVARHIGWTKLAGSETMFSVPEPDNYNRAILTKKPVECVFVEDQVIYKDLNKDMWITLLYIPDEQLGEYNAWTMRLKPEAYWQHTQAPKIRYRKDSLA